LVCLFWTKSNMYACHVSKEHIDKNWTLHKKKIKNKTKHNQSCVTIENTKLYAWPIDITQKMTKCLLLKHKFFFHYIPLWFYKFHDAPPVIWINIRIEPFIKKNKKKNKTQSVMCNNWKYKIICVANWYNPKNDQMFVT